MVKAPESIKEIFVLAARGIPSVLKRVWGLAFAMLAFDQIVGLFLGFLRNKNDETLLISYVIAYLAIHFAMVSLLVIVVNQAYADYAQSQERNLIQVFKYYFKPMLIESARVCGWLALGLILFVIPALVWAVRLYWVIFVVQFDPLYDKGEVDALAQSKGLTQGHFLLSALILLCATVIDWGSQGLLAVYDPLTYPKTFLFAFVLTILATLYSSGILFYGYHYLVSKKRGNKWPSDSNLQKS